MNAEIIAVGSELLLGQIANTNAQFLSEQLAMLGINVYFHTVVGDNPDRLKMAVKQAEKRADLIIFTGGLGPTKDDLTKETISKILGRQLVYDQEALQSILDYYKKTGRHMTENNRKQALVIEGSDVLPNRQGMAPGMLTETSGRTYILLPGPPFEMRPMYLDYVKPHLSGRHSEQIVSRVLKFFGIGESALETEIMDLIDGQSNPTIAPLAKESEVTLRLTAKHTDRLHAEQMIDQTEQLIKGRVGQYFYGYDPMTLPMAAFYQLKENSLTVAAAESLTGGLFSKQLTDIPGASDVFKGSIISYSNDVKERQLDIPASLLASDGAVSEACAKAMAQSVRAKCGADIGVSFTGVAGPEKSEDKDVGTVYIGIADAMTAYSFLYHMNGTRPSIRIRTAKSGFDLLRRYVLKTSPFN
ncbi:competence/damage-inducible protein cinA [Scopulibacillus darangshiensis]|uniref:Putative competence-damage inducible protein n=1 Tax=Scopulibacillus darangshiensis TaxID=442528 RepID=A0A4R2P615_9BACL|nr:competence/damage-inducible protein A [Scopulibacillus darangshiensis]TCP30263.1 competence/damage-inducible protein cinA [Scopulibacillus darangshiensis]